MGLEIERKFLVDDGSYASMAERRIEMQQGYLSRSPKATVRVRVAGDSAWLTVKGLNHGTVRSEWEYSIPAADAREMLAQCCDAAGIISKTRCIVPYGSLRWEVDAFHGCLEGLVVAEVELPSADVQPELPPFVGREVTGDARYYNSSLAAASAPPCD